MLPPRVTDYRVRRVFAVCAGHHPRPTLPAPEERGPRLRAEDIRASPSERPQPGGCMNYKTEERRAWVAFMAARLSVDNGNTVAERADKADLALEEYRKRFPAPAPLVDGSEWQ